MERHSEHQPASQSPRRRYLGAALSGLASVYGIFPRPIARRAPGDFNDALGRAHTDIERAVAQANQGRFTPLPDRDFPQVGEDLQAAINDIEERKR